ncbi:MAG: cytochrome c oxidase subunit 3 [Alphaproteobacteria bacterium]|nr:cytochrome c oxidase subunit 3 [Sinomicrobium sp.]MCB1783907.1 cytochrome c oxidase subunit 3 [Alphaproteobacteria bacterium]
MAGHIEYSTTGKPHPYHLVRPSIWPLAGSLAGGLLAVGALMYLHDVSLFADPEKGVAGYKVGLNGVYLGLLAVLLVMFGWWKDVIYESVKERAHTPIAAIGLRYGMSLFIASEVMFFVAFFWAFFNAAFFPGEQIGYVWPPANIHTVDPFDLPFLMTMILLLSGCTVTWAHHAILSGNNKDAVTALGVTVFLGVVFLCFQVYEYAHAHFGFTEGIYPSAFYMATGFHGFHVFVGTIFLFVCWIRAMKGHFTPERHFGFEAAAWYWHFVDVVWLFLFVAIYWWGNMVGMDLSALHKP